MRATKQKEKNTGETLKKEYFVATSGVDTADSGARNSSAKTQAAIHVAVGKAAAGGTPWRGASVPDPSPAASPRDIVRPSRMAPDRWLSSPK